MSNAFLRSSERRISWLCLRLLPILMMGFDEVREGGLCENLLRAIEEIFQKRSNLIYLLHFIGVIDRVNSILKSQSATEVQVSAHSFN